jgi:IPT/TIG domain
VVSSLSATSGTAGQTVVISGANFLSSDGQIVARFGGQTTPTSCPEQHTCTVTVPPQAGAPTTVPVTITTAAGTSNAMNFAYT